MNLLNNNNKINSSNSLLKKELFDIPVDDLDYNLLYNKIREAINSHSKITINYINANTIRLIDKNNDLKKAILNADIIHPDGIGIWLASRIMKNSELKVRFNFTDCSFNFLEDCQKHGWSLFLLGASDGILKKASQKLQKTFPDLKILGMLNGYADSEAESTIEIINNKSPDILWVGMGTPKQELWINKNRVRINSPVVHAVGDLITHLAGEKTRGPILIQKLGFEWLARLLMHPGKYFNRYAVGIPAFISILLKEVIFNLRKTEN